MREMSVDQVRRAVRGRWRARGDEAPITFVSTDTRDAKAGELFVALRGERFDAHHFLDAAADAGCVAAIVDADAGIPDETLRRFGAGVVGVPDTMSALGDLARAQRERLPATVVAVTGSNGKTTVKRMIHHVLSRTLDGACSPKSFNNEIGVPLTLLGVKGTEDYVVCELGSNAPGEIAHLAAIARPDVAVVTNVSRAHLERLGGIDGVAAEKASILGGLSPNGLGVVTADSEPLGRALRAYDDVRLVRFGTSDDADLRLTDYDPGDGRQRFELNGRLWVELPLAGRHNALNALAAIAAAQRMGVSQDDAAAALRDFAGVEMRLQREWIGELLLMNDAYNANPDSVLAAADVLAETPAKRRVMICGDMRELGDDAESLHVDTGGEIAARGVDLVIGVGDLGRCIADGAADRGGDAESFDTVDQAVDAVGDLLRDGDAVLLKGSRATAMERLVEPIRRAFAGGDTNRPARRRSGTKQATRDDGR